MRDRSTAAHVAVRWGTFALASVLTFAARAAAQPASRFSVDSTVSFDTFGGQNANSRPNIVVDVSTSMRISNGWTAYFRPWFVQPRVDEWYKEIYQAAVQYQHSGRVSTRVDVGYIASPVGLGLMDSRPGVNPTILPHLAYFVPLPKFDSNTASIAPVAPAYPLGAEVTVSSRKWDSRLAIVDTAPTRMYVLGAATNPPHAPVLEGGVGISPTTGMRVGLSLAHGDYISGRELVPAAPQGRKLTQLGFEGEYGFSYTRVSGEVLRDDLETAGGHAAAYEWFIEGAQTLAPRWFVAGRSEGTSAPGFTSATAARPRTSFRVNEITLGYRMSTELTLRSSFVDRKAFQRDAWDRQIGASVVWSRRWW